MTYNAKADKKYNAESKHIGLKFTKNELDFYNQIEKYCNSNGLTKQKFIKELIAEKLRMSDDKQL